MLKKYTKLILIVFCACCSLQSCLFLHFFAEDFTEDDVTRIPIKFINKSGENIYVMGWYYLGNNILTSAVLIQQISDWTRLISDNDIYDLHEIPLDGNERKDSHQFLIIKEETMNNNSQEDIINNNIYDDLLIFTYDELVEMNYEVIYTGKEEEPQNPNPGEPDL